MKKLTMILTLMVSLGANAQCSYNPPNIDVTKMWELTPRTPTSYWTHYESRQLMWNGIALAGITGDALHFNTIGDGPYIPFAIISGTAAVGKFIHAGIVRKHEKGYDEWGRRLL